MDPYKVLGLEKGATVEEVKRAFGKLANKFNPDLPDGGNEKKFREIVDAYKKILGTDSMSVVESKPMNPGHHIPSEMVDKTKTKTVKTTDDKLDLALRKFEQSVRIDRDLDRSGIDILGLSAVILTATFNDFGPVPAGGLWALFFLALIIVIGMTIFQARKKRKSSEYVTREQLLKKLTENDDATV